MKKLILTGMILSLVLILAPDAMAARTKNTKTSKDSKNIAVVRDEKTTRVRNLNLGLVVNGELVGINTGGNTANKNTGCCGEENNCGDCCGSCLTENTDSGKNKITTGNGVVNITTDDWLNDTNIKITQSDSENTDVAENECTGTNSLNVAKTERQRKVTVGNASIGGVVNLSVVGVNSGNNSANGNTGGEAIIKTGDGEANITHTSTVNTTTVTISQ